MCEESRICPLSWPAHLSHRERWVAFLRTPRKLKPFMPETDPHAPIAYCTAIAAALFFALSPSVCPAQSLHGLKSATKPQLSLASHHPPKPPTTMACRFADGPC